MLLELELPHPLLDLVHACETLCVAGCCGLDAFDVDAEHLIRFANQRDVKSLWVGLEQISELNGDIRDYDGQVSLDAFNAWWETAAECIEYLRDWQKQILRALSELNQFESFQSKWRTTTVLGIADAIYADREFGNLPVLADALEDAGCDHADILSHCRGPGPHVRGCWVVDLVLGKS